MKISNQFTLEILIYSQTPLRLYKKDLEKNSSNVASYHVALEALENAVGISTLEIETEEKYLRDCVTLQMPEKIALGKKDRVRVWIRHH